MIEKIKAKLLILSSIVMLAVPLAIPAAVSAIDNTTIQQGACFGAQELEVSSTGQEPCVEPNDNGGISGLIKKIINILSVIVGVVAVIMIIIGGFRYITSGGASEKVTSA